jgi:autoinducer 2-degrading protein
VLAVLVEFIVHENHRQAFIQRVQQQAKDSLALEDECHYFDVCTDDANPARIVLYEIYGDTAAFELHLASDHFHRFDKDVSDWVISRDICRLNQLAAD